MSAPDFIAERGPVRAWRDGEWYYPWEIPLGALTLPGVGAAKLGFVQCAATLADAPRRIQVEVPRHDLHGLGAPLVLKTRAKLGHVLISPGKAACGREM